jgi:hypothetical protein
MGPTNENHFFFYYQTLKYVVAGEPHPQPHYQTASKLWDRRLQLLIAIAVRNEFLFEELYHFNPVY